MPPPSHVREYPVVECDLEFVELTRLGVPLEVHAADPSELPSIAGRPVPEHGAFVARVLPRHVTSGDDAGLTYTHDDDDDAKASTSFTRVWARDPEGGAVVVPAPLDGPLRDHLDELVVLSDDWFVLGLRFEADAEIRRVFNLHGFASIARGYLRLFVVPSVDDGDARARVFVTCGGKEDSPLAKLTSAIPLFHVDEPPALEMLRAYVEGPTSAAFPSTHDGEMNRIEVTGSNPAWVRTADGLFPHQARTARWMAAVEASDGSSDTRGDGSSDDTRGDALVSPVRFAGRVMHPDGVEHTECETREDALDRLNLKRQKSDNSKAEYHSGPYATIGNALAAALTSSSGEKAGRGTRTSAVRAPRLPPGGLIAHPVGAGKTVICAAFLAREKRRDETSPARDGSSDTRDGSSDDFDGNTLVVCPAHIVTQWLEALRRFAPNLRCRRADAGDIGEINELNASDSSCKVDCTFDVEDRRGIDDAADWDVIVCAHEDVPEVYVRGSTSGSNPGPSGGKTRTHPLWDYDFVGPVTEDGDEAENKQVKNGIRWRRLIVDEPQELDFTWRLNRYSGNGAWLTTVLNAKHRWALTATPYVTGDGARDVASLTFGTMLGRREYRRVRARWTERRCVRDPPGACLPVPPVEYHAVPVTLTWHEASVVQLYSEAFDATFHDVISLCGGFGGERSLNDDPSVDGSIPTAITDGASTYESMEQWAARHTESHARSLARLERRRDGLLAAAKRLDDKYEKELAAAGGINPFEHLDDLITEEALADRPAWEDVDTDAEAWDGGGGTLDLRKMSAALAAESKKSIETTEHATPEEPSSVQLDEEQIMADIGQLAGRMLGASFGTPTRTVSDESDEGESSSDGEFDSDKTLADPDRSLGIRRDLDAINHRLDHSRRALAFVQAAAAQLRDPKAECAVCFERLGGKSVTVLRCLHHFDKTCVARLIAANSARGGGGASARTVTCPLCRVPTRRKNMCTFIHRHVRAQGSAEGDEETEEEEEEETETEVQSTSRVGSKPAALADLLDGILRSNPGDKVVVFAQRPETVAAIASRVAARIDQSPPSDTSSVVTHPVAVALLGTASHRAAVLESFNSNTDDSPRVLCMSYGHHASGLNLHVANHVVVAHPFAARNIAPGAPDLTPLASAMAYETQAVGRVARYPQGKTCHVYRMFAVGTVEEELYAVWGLV